MMFLLLWALKNREETFYSALNSKWPILRKAFESLGCQLPADPVCSSALSQARQKVGYKPFDDLLGIGNRTHLRKHDNLTRFKGYQLYVTDGSNLNLHSNKTLAEAFGRPNSTGVTKATPQASFTTLQLVNTGWIVGYCLGRYDASELSQTKILARSLGKGDLLLGDRLSFDTQWFYELVQKCVEFLFRATSSRYKSFSKESQQLIEAMRKKGDVDCVVDLKIKGNSKKLLKVRYIEIFREGQETLRFITSLFQNEFSMGEIETLYRLRWEVETEFRFFKGPDHLPVILSRTEETVRQEVAVRILAHNTVRHTQADACTNALDITITNKKSCNPSVPQIEKEEPQLIRIIADEKWQKKNSLWPTMPLRPVDLQFNNTLSLITGYIVNSSIYPPTDYDEAWKKLLDEIVKGNILVKDGRSYYRKGKQYHKSERNKGDRKAQRQRRKRRKEAANRETE